MRLMTAALAGFEHRRREWRLICALAPKMWTDLMRLVDQVRLIPTDRKRKLNPCNNLRAENRLLRSGRKVGFNSPIQHDFIVMCEFAP